MDVFVILLISFHNVSVNNWFVGVDLFACFLSGGGGGGGLVFVDVL